MIQVAIADDHELIRKGLHMLIEVRTDMRVLFESSSYQELIKELHKHQPDILILDLNLGDSNGLHTIENITQSYPSLPILILSAYPENVYALRAFRSGASGYLNKSAVSEELITAIITVTEGRRYISQGCEEIFPLGIEMKKEERDLGEILSKRELEVLHLIAEGKPPKEIAKIMSLSPKTISTYRTRIMEKLELESSNQLQRFAYEILSG